MRTKDLCREGFDWRRVELAESKLPDRVEDISDVYFVRTRDILRARGWNPWLRAQTFIRKGPGVVAGIYDLLAVFNKYTPFFDNGGKIWALEEGDKYDPLETQVIIEGKADDFIHLETAYLGLLSSASTRVNDGIDELDLEAVRRRMSNVVRATKHPRYGIRPVTYFGARHYNWDADIKLATACFDAGAVACSTDMAAKVMGERAVGTIPHALENVVAYYGDMDRAVVDSTVAFDEVIDPRVPRVALIDYNNREIADTLATAAALRDKGSSLFAARVDTHGGNVAEGALETADCAEAEEWRKDGIYLPTAKDPIAKFWYGTGVTVTGVYALRKALDEAGFNDVGIFLTSGFGKPEKVRAFVEAEHLLGVKLFDGLGVGEVHPGRFATMDIVGVGEDATSLRTISKVGRPPVPNSRLRLAMGMD